ncbi:hypothetical protein DTL42_19410 [Bremerella cremea]|uniref:Uncharacterized protein n=1 Tax=Bremerella cremea TaxID=1031537 RepID=A0A368KPE2_9BACT|nr:hypothetical protein [Bremerella cremea]RCS42308.1 hypothetical protein DTL42_19410 [Bremerella cremea]
MDELAKLITTPAWWISTVIIAFLVNIAAAYAKPLIDNLVATWSTKRRERLEEEKKREDAVVLYLIDNPIRLIDVRTDATYTTLRMILSLTLAVLLASFLRFLQKYLQLYYFIDGTVAGIYFVCMVDALRHFRRFRGLRRIIDEYTRSVHTYDNMPVDVLKRIKEEEREAEQKH